MKAWLMFIGSSLLVSCGAIKVENKSETQAWQQPDEAFRIGRGYDSQALEPVRGDCLMNPEKYLVSNWLDAQGVKAQISETRISSRESLYRELNLTSNAKVKYGPFSGGGSFTQYEKFTASDDSFTWLFSLKAAIGSKTLQTEQLDLDAFKPEARQLILAVRAGNFAAKKSFHSLCGHQFIRSVQLGGALTDVLEISAKAVDQVKQLSAKMKASYGSGSFGISGKASLRSLFEEAEKSSFLKREFQQVGGERIEFQLTDANVKDVLDQYVRDLRQQNAAVIEVELADWDTVLDFAPSDPIDIARSMRIDQLLRQLWRYQDTLHKIESALDLYEQDYYDFNADELSALNKTYGEVSEAMDSVLALGRSCYLDAKACGEASKQIVFHIPKPRQKALAFEKPYQLGSWRVLFPGPSSALHVEAREREGNMSRLWSFDEMLVGRTFDGHLLGLKTHLFEADCSQTKELASSPRFIASADGNPIYYAEGLRNFPGDKQRYLASFLLRSKTQCLEVQMSSEPREALGFSVEDGSPLSQTLRRFISTIEREEGS